VAPAVFLDKEELAALDHLAAGGTRIEARAVPSDAPLALGEIHARFALQ
jgi:PTS system mannose-specific IIB component